MPPRRPPGPKAHGLSGHLPELRRDRLGFFTRCAREYGDVVANRFSYERAVLVSHPDLVGEVLATHPQRFRKDRFTRGMSRFLGDGLLPSEGERWLRHRRLAQPAFHRQRLEGYAAAIVEAAERAMEGWRPGQARDAHADMMRLTLDIVARVLSTRDRQGSGGGRRGPPGVPRARAHVRGPPRARAPLAAHAREPALPPRAPPARRDRGVHRGGAPGGRGGAPRPPLDAPRRARRRGLGPRRPRAPGRGRDPPPRGARDDGERPLLGVAPPVPEPRGRRLARGGAPGRARGPRARRRGPARLRVAEAVVKEAMRL